MRFRFGAVLARGRRRIGVGYNYVHNAGNMFDDKKSWLRSSVHAEHSVLKACQGDAEGATLYVVRLYRDDSRAMARPCRRCQRRISEAGIKKVIYTNEFGRLSVERFLEE